MLPAGPLPEEIGVEDFLIELLAAPGVPVAAAEVGEDEPVLFAGLGHRARSKLMSHSVPFLAGGRGGGGGRAQDAEDCEKRERPAKRAKRGCTSGCGQYMRPISFMPGIFRGVDYTPGRGARQNGLRGFPCLADEG